MKYVFIIIVLLFLFIIYSSCVVSSKCARKEEIREYEKDD